MKLFCVYSLESPHHGDSNKYTQYTIFQDKKKEINLKYPKFAAMRFSLGFKNAFETAVVNEPSVFEPLKFHCIPKGENNVKLERQTATQHISQTAIH